MLTYKEFHLLLSFCASLPPKKLDLRLSEELESKGLLHQGQLTDQATNELKNYRVDNAVILAAGLSSRFAPISYERPKGLLKVRGEVLIERQIKHKRRESMKSLWLSATNKSSFTTSKKNSVCTLLSTTSMPLATTMLLSC